MPSLTIYPRWGFDLFSNRQYVFLMKSFLCNFKAHEPPERLTQQETIDWLKAYHIRCLEDASDGEEVMVKAKKERIEAFFDRFAVSDREIGSRRSYVRGMGKIDWSADSFFNIEKLNPDMEERGRYAQTAIEKIFKDLYEDESLPPEHILHVTCTHYESPSGAQKLIAAKDWNQTTIATHLYHMGCYASLPAIRTASALNKANSEFVDIVHTELCSLHLNGLSHSPEQVIVQSLFGDGAIRYQCLSEKAFLSSEQDGFEVLAQKEIIAPNSAEEMSWKIGAERFNMTLSKKAPSFLASAVKSFCEDLFSAAGLSLAEHKPACEFAIHPGGPKIINSIKEALDLDETQVQNSRDILFERGNMSSSTLPHIWQRVLNKSSYEYMATLAFGPGLTMTGAVLRICRI